MTVTLLNGDALATLRTLDAGSVRCCVTSPPYYGLRDYGHAGQIGLEDTPEAYVARLVEVFREVRRVLSDDGTLWLNLGDSYAGSGKASPLGSPNLSRHAGQGVNPKNASAVYGSAPTTEGYKTKDLLGIPWMVAFALRADGWYLRSSIVWAKPNAMPESVRDRPTKSHEMIFLLSKSPRYFYDHEAIKEPATGHAPGSRGVTADQKLPEQYFGTQRIRQGKGATSLHTLPDAGRNKRDVWTVSTKPYAGAHFATMPPALVEPCILAGSATGDTVLDPFAGSGTTGAVAVQHGRDFLGIELNAEYLELARKRIGAAQPPLAMAAD